MTAFFRNPFDRWAADGGADAPPAERAPAPPEPKPEAARPKIGVALGAGAARGWSHIGVLRELAAHGVVPDVVAGTSIGAVVGSCYAAGKLDEIESFARSLTKRRVFRMMDISFSGMSLIGGERLRVALERELADQRIEDLPIAFAVVATEVGSGHEVWLKRGPLAQAVRASYALPGIFEPVRIGDRWLFDGALVNPIPITVCRALGADFVIAVNVTADTMYRSHIIHDHHGEASGAGAAQAPFAERRDSVVAEHLLPRYFQRRPGAAPNVAASMIDAFNIIQDRILRSRMAGDPPDATIHARHEDVGMFDFHRAKELIELGHEATKRSLPNIFAHIPLVGATP
ncbi:patatin-like phospholipase family protein [Methylosinus sp. Sm6]|uniref:patatin-like phospholipase family protein n=1 Tax=Methylosinus sp. Sm6 TaxID=2866948 RepID=UPI001C99E1F3|nr:patatin-like phospholipase family protein [Methylosinus sp. Sm6]MBY6240641.1 patatin-like phospholipase family protein [Methylosinus sp. Sm6]